MYNKKINKNIKIGTDELRAGSSYNYYNKQRGKNERLIYQSSNTSVQTFKFGWSEIDLAVCIALFGRISGRAIQDG